MSVGEYSRISEEEDAPDRRGLAIARQRTDTGALLKLRRWKSGGHYSDPDVSAYKPGVVRKDFERMLTDLKSGKLTGIAAYDLDRLFRQPVDLERVIAIYDAIPGLKFATVQGDIDLSTPDGRTLARVMVAFANKSSMDTARRVSRKKLARALNGDSTSNFRAYGWNEDGSLHKQEAAVLKQAVKDVLAGLGLYVICDRLNSQNIRTVRGHTWKTSAMRRVLTAPRLVGHAVYRGEVVNGPDGNPVKGNWKPLVDESTWLALNEALRPRKGTYPKRKKKYLLSSILRCGLCGMGMAGGTRDGRVRYMCRSKDSGGCAKVGISGHEVELAVAYIVMKLESLGIGVDESEVAAFSGQDRLTEISGKIVELMNQYREGLSGSIVFPTVRELEEEQRQLLAERGRLERANKSKIPDGHIILPNTVEERQLIIGRYITEIVIKPTGRTGRFDLKRVDIVWREGIQEKATALGVSLDLDIPAEGEWDRMLAGLWIILDTEYIDVLTALNGHKQGSS